MSIDTVKRFYLPDSFVWMCPMCGLEHEWDNYLSYPSAGVAEELYGYCEHWDHAADDWVEGFCEDDEPFEDIVGWATVNIEVVFEEADFG